MILDPSGDFDSIRQDTLALMLRDPQLVFYYGAGAAKIALSLIDEISYADDASLEESIAIINESLEVVRGVVVFDRSLGGGIAVDRLRNEIGELADTYAELAGVTYFEAECHGRTLRTVTCPVLSDVVLESTLSDSYSVGHIDKSAVTSFGGEGYLTASYIAELLKGEVMTEEVLGRGIGAGSLRDFIDTYTGHRPFSLKCGGVERIIHAGADADLVVAALTASGHVGERWVAVTEHVALPRGRGRQGPLYVWRAHPTAVVPELYVREGDVWAGPPEATVVSVEGATIKFDGSVRASGEGIFVNTSRETWERLTPKIRDVALSSTTFRGRVEEASTGLNEVSSVLEQLSVAFYRCRGTVPADIRSAHYAVGADYACGLLESGDFLEYVSLCECMDSSDKVLSVATSRAKLGAGQ